MISKEIKNVSGTKLFCGVNRENTRQITIYANTVDNISKNNAMVLPVPFPNSVIFHNLENYKDFFSECERCFYNVNNSLEYSITNNIADSNKNTLDVYNVGSYKVSLACSLQDLQHVDTSVFELSNGLKKILNKHYSNPIFGFIICKLVDGNEKYHPFAYSHNIANEKIFIPTRHFHDENNNPYFYDYEMFTSKKYTSTNINNSPMFNSWKLTKNLTDSKNDFELADDWEHDIYLYNVDINSNLEVKKMNTCHEKWNNKVNKNLNKLDFALDTNCKIFNKLQINGSNPNVDLVLAIYH
jgi:hypothetical protein